MSKYHNIGPTSVSDHRPLIKEDEKSPSINATSKYIVPNFAHQSNTFKSSVTQQQLRNDLIKGIGVNYFYGYLHAVTVKCADTLTYEPLRTTAGGGIEVGWPVQFQHLIHYQLLRDPAVPSEVAGYNKQTSWALTHQWVSLTGKRLKVGSRS